MDTWAALFGETRPAHTLLSKGNTGGEVYYLQKLMWEKEGFYLYWNSTFGDDTLDDVYDLQNRYGLEVDGKVGSATWAKLEE